MKLYIDGLNFKRRFWREGTNPWNLKQVHLQISRFVQACKNREIETVVFLDATRHTKEAIRKHRQRYALQLRKASFALPAGSTLIYGEIFKSLGVTVLYSSGADNDDTLAAFAQRDGAAVLSRDQDFFRYNDRNFEIYSDFSFKKGQLILKKAEFNEKRDISKRDIIDIPKVIENLPQFADLPKFIKLSPITPLAKYFEMNQSVAYRPLRQALYHKFGVSSVEERYVDVDSEGNSTWIEEVVSSDPAFTHLLMKPDIAVKKFMGDYLKKIDCDPHQWALHEFGIYLAIYEVYYMAIGGAVNFYTIMSDLGQQFRHQSHTGNRNKQYQSRGLDPRNRVNQEEIQEGVKKNSSERNGKRKSQSKPTGFGVPTEIVVVVTKTVDIEDATTVVPTEVLEIKVVGDIAVDVADPSNAVDPKVLIFELADLAVTDVLVLVDPMVIEIVDLTRDVVAVKKVHIVALAVEVLPVGHF
ncbi:hypothetical protein HDV01_007157 [Terramyces sp. JEL0728]|nr:hypothetical protein HDV01_007157 [Terramyces sp. JEL0728]